MQLCLPVWHLLLNILQASQISLVRSLSLNAPSSLAFPPGLSILAVVLLCAYPYIQTAIGAYASHVHLFHSPTSHIVYKLGLRYSRLLSTPASPLCPSCHPLPGSWQTSAKRSALHLPSCSCLPHGNSFFCLTAMITGTESEMATCLVIPGLDHFSVLSWATFWFITAVPCLS